MNTSAQIETIFAGMFHNRSYLLLSMVCSTVFLSCSDSAPGEGSNAGKQYVRRVRRSGKHGRIVEKVNVVQIPLTASENNLKGRVHTVRYQHFVYEEGTARKLADSGFNVYDTKGHLVKQSAWTGEGAERWKCTYSYDSKSLLQGWMLNMVARGETDTSTFLYDEDGYKIKSISKTNNPSTSGSKEYTYDVHGNEVLEKHFNVAGRLRRIFRSSYDRRDNQVEIAELFPDGTVWSKKVATYDATASLTSLTSYLQDSLTGKTVMTNNAAGKHVEIASLGKDGTVRGRTQLSYNEMGNVLERIATDGDGRPVGKLAHIEFEYQYDANGNVTLERTLVSKGGNKSKYAETMYQYSYYR